MCMEELAVLAQKAEFSKSRCAEGGVLQLSSPFLMSNFSRDVFRKAAFQCTDFLGLFSGLLVQRCSAELPE